MVKKQHSVTLFDCQTHSGTEGLSATKHKPSFAEYLGSVCCPKIATPYIGLRHRVVPKFSRLQCETQKVPPSKKSK